MLTAEFCEGCKVNDVEAIKTMGLAAKDVSAAGISTRMWEGCVHPKHRVMVA